MGGVLRRPLPLSHMNAPERIFSAPKSAAPVDPVQRWQQRLADARLPLLSAQADVVRMLGSRLSVHELVERMEQDLPLAVDMMVAASNTLRSSGKPLLGLQHAVNLLGMDRVQVLVRARQAHTLDRSKPEHVMALQAMATSRFAGIVLMDWTARHPGTHAEHLYWVTALMGLARWKLPLVAPQLARSIEQRVAAGEPRGAVEHAMLGCSVEAINTAHLLDLGLPDVADLRQRMAMDPKLLATAARMAWTDRAPPDVTPEVGRWLHQPTSASPLAYALALSAQDSWYSKRTQTLMAVASVHLSQHMDHTHRDTRRLALVASQESTYYPFVTAPATRLLWMPPEPRKLTAATNSQSVKLANKPQPVLAALTGATAPAGKKVKSASDWLHDYEQQCNQSLHINLKSFMAATLNTLEHGLGLHRCALFLKPAGTEELSCFMAHGFGTALVSRQLTLPAGGEHLLARLMGHPEGALCVTGKQMDAARKQLPKALALLALPSGLVLGTVHIKQRPMGIWWADTGHQDEPLDAASYAGFQRVTHIFGREFTRLVQRQREANQASATA